MPLVGARLKRPLVVGLVFAFGWEPGVLLFPGYLKQLTVAYYLQALVPHAMPDDSTISVLLQVFQEVPSVSVEPGLAGGDYRRCRCGWPPEPSRRENTCWNSEPAALRIAA